MRTTDSHISDEDLIRLLDGELSEKKMSGIRQHVTACWSCRGRMREFEGAIDRIVELRRDDIDVRIPPPDRARRMLQLRMEQLSTAPVFAPGWRNLVSGFRARKVMLACAMLVVLIAFALMMRRGNPRLPEEARSIPDPALTPGATLPVTKDHVCSAGRVEARRMIAEPVARQVFAAYGISRPAPGSYELDYLITPALGGDDNIRNFWPQPYGTTIWNAHLKDALEDHLYRLVCEDRLELSTAQRDISQDWIQAYKKYFRTSRPLPEHSTYLRDQPWE